MASQYNIDTFIAGTRSSSIEFYCKKRGLDFKPTSGLSKEDAFKEVIEFIENLDPDRRKEVEAEFKTINELTPRAGVDILKTRLEEQGELLPGNFEDMTPHDMAIWCFLEHQDAFMAGIDLYELRDSSGWEDAIIKNTVGNDYANKQKALEDAIKGELMKRCVVRKYSGDDGQLSYVAYMPSNPDLILGFGPDQELDSPQYVQFIEKVYFTYKDAPYHRLSVKSGGGKSVKTRFRDIFVRVVLKNDPTNITDKVFDLNVLKDRDKEFKCGPEVKSFYVKSITLKSYGKKERVVIEDLTGEQVGMRGIQTLLDKMNRPELYSNITAAKIYAFFNEAPKGSKRTVTIDLRYPNGHNFKEKPLHNQLRVYLTQWGISALQSDEIITEYAKSELSS